MRSERQGEVHRHVALAATGHDAATTPTRSSSEAVAHQETPAASFSLLRLSLGARFLIVAAMSALLWGAVFWALR